MIALKNTIKPFPFFVVYDNSTKKGEEMSSVLECYQPMIPNKPIDEDLHYVELFIAGDELAFTTLVNKYRRYVFSIAYRFVQDISEADDLTQETFIRAFNHLKSFRKESSFKTWLSRIVTNLSINVKKSNRISKDSGLSPEDLNPSVNAESLDQILKEEQNNKLRIAISNLAPKQKETLLLRTYRDMSCKEVAHIMQCSVGTVKANLFNAIKNLKTMMNPRNEVLHEN